MLCHILMSVNVCWKNSAYLVFVSKYGTDQEVSNLIDEYINIIPDTHKDYLTLSKAYFQIQKYEDALRATEQYNDKRNAPEEIKYKALISMIYEKLGNYEESLRAYKEYMIVSDSTNYAIMRQDTKFVEDTSYIVVCVIYRNIACNYRIHSLQTKG